MYKFFALSFLGLLLVGAGCKQDDVWTPFYYVGGDQYNVIYGPPFSDPLQCMTWARNKKGDLRDADGTYECGSNCRLESAEYELYICDKTY